MSETKNGGFFRTNAQGERVINHTEEGRRQWMEHMEKVYPGYKAMINKAVQDILSKE